MSKKCAYVEKAIVGVEPECEGVKSHWRGCPSLELWRGKPSVLLLRKVKSRVI